MADQQPSEQATSQPSRQPVTLRKDELTVTTSLPREIVQYQAAGWIIEPTDDDHESSSEDGSSSDAKSSTSKSGASKSAASKTSEPAADAKGGATK